MNETQEKNRVALSSVLAAVVLTSGKLIIGFMTGSLGILSEAAHSSLDLLAAIMTLFAVRMADRPADVNHNFGHGKIENISALFETLLLLLTCVWIIYEAIQRLLVEVIIEVTFWSYAIIITSIIVDISRSRALNRVAKKYNSQALEADALHFSTDILSSLVVLFGLIVSHFGYHKADAFAALFVSVIVIYISTKLGIKSIKDLIDTAPHDKKEIIEEIINSVSEVVEFHDLKIRNSGSETFVEFNIHVQKDLSIEQAHNIAHIVENKIKDSINKCSVHIHIEPD